MTIRGVYSCYPIKEAASEEFKASLADAECRAHGKAMQDAKVCADGGGGGVLSLISAIYRFPLTTCSGSQNVN